MSLNIAFWVIMLVWLLFGAWHLYQSANPMIIGGNLIVFVLFLILGWKVFGAPLQG